MDANIRLAVGTRLHGSIIAMNCGVPSVCTAGDTRAQETCAYLGIPHLPGYCGLDLDLGALLESIDTDEINRKYIATYEHYRNWLNINQLL